MKKFIFAAAAVAMLASCSNDETVSSPRGNAIGFNSFVNKSTLTRVQDDITLQNLGKVWVYGWRGDNLIFDAQEVAVDGSGTGTYNPLQYWEANYIYAFEAISPKAGESGVEFTAAKEGGKITFTNNATTDLLYAKPANVTTPATFTTMSPVGLDFKHLLSRVKFTFVNGFPENAAAKITVTDVKITDACKKAEVTPANTGAAWTSLDADNDKLAVAFPGTIADVEAGNKSGVTEHMYLIPLSDVTYTVTFTVELDQNGAKTEYNHTVKISGDAAAMLMGNSYNFTATLNAGNIDPDNALLPIEFTATVADWDAFNTNVTEIMPEDTNN